MKYCTCSGKSNQPENYIMYYKAKSKNRRQGRVEFTSLNGFMDLIFAISSPAQILGRSHFTQVSVASSKMRRFIRQMKGGVTIHVSPTAVQAPLRDPSQLCSSVQPPSSPVHVPHCVRPVPTPGLGGHSLYQPLHPSFALVWLCLL